MNFWFGFAVGVSLCTFLSIVFYLAIKARLQKVPLVQRLQEVQGTNEVLTQRIEELCLAIDEARTQLHVPEINLNNYSEDDIRVLNDASTAAYTVLGKAKENSLQAECNIRVIKSDLEEYQMVHRMVRPPGSGIRPSPSLLRQYVVELQAAKHSSDAEIARLRQRIQILSRVEVNPKQS